MQKKIEKENEQEVTPIPLTNTDVLADFIVSLLGQKRSHTQEFEERRFIITHNWLLNLHEVINQRVKSQNHEARLVSFASKFFYENGRTTELSDISSFKAFHDMSNILSQGVELRWKYLINFPNSNHPETQEIRFLAFMNKDILWKMSFRPKRSLWFFFDKKKEHLSYEVMSTNVTWCEDLCTHITNYIASKTEEVSKWKCWIRKVRSSVLVPSLLSLALMGYTFGAMSKNIKSLKEQFQTKYGDVSDLLLSLKTTEQKIDFLVSRSIFDLEKTASLEVFPPIIDLIGVVFCFFLVFYVLPERKDSYVCLNSHSQNVLDGYEKRYALIRYTLVIGLVVGIISSLLSSRIEKLLFPFFS